MPLGFVVAAVYLFLFVCLFVSRQISLCSPGCPGTHAVEQAGSELRDPPASVLGSKECAAAQRRQQGFFSSMEKILQYI